MLSEAATRPEGLRQHQYKHSNTYLHNLSIDTWTHSSQTVFDLLLPLLLMLGVQIRLVAHSRILPSMPDCQQAQSSSLARHMQHVLHSCQHHASQAAPACLSPTND
jgi:hypothetical protein